MTTPDTSEDGQTHTPSYYFSNMTAIFYNMIATSIVIKFEGA